MSAGLLLVSVALGQSGLVDLTRARSAELEALPGIGPAKATALLTWQAQHGPCTALDDLAAVPGFGRATRLALQGRAMCGPIPDPPVLVTVPSLGVPVLAPALHPTRIDPNVASVDELRQLPGVDAALAGQIVADRIERGAYATCKELGRVPGIGPATLANLRTRCMVAGDPKG